MHPVAAEREIGDIPLFSAIVLAGQRPGIDPLAAHFGETYKALVPVAGEPMLSRVVRSLIDMPKIGRVVVLAQDVAAIAQAGDFVVEASGPTIASTIAPLIEHARAPLLITTADHALLDAAMLDHFITRAQGADLAIGLVERRTLLAAYPTSKRTWLRFRGGAFSGANLFWIGSAKVMPLLEIWARVEQRRKRGRALIGAFGPLLLLGVALRLLSLEDALARVGRRFGLTIKAVILPQAEACIDVDSVADHALVEQILARRKV